jgi:isopenicillin N synthase-like dioxygenase
MPPPAKSNPARGAAEIAARVPAAADFTSIPILSLASARVPATKPRFLAELRRALLDVGFAYLSDLYAPSDGRGGEPADVETKGVMSDDLVRLVCEQARLFFDEDVLPRAEKEIIEMKNQPSFLGWSRVSPNECFDSKP